MGAKDVPQQIKRVSEEQRETNTNSEKQTLASEKLTVVVTL